MTDLIAHWTLPDLLDITLFNLTFDLPPEVDFSAGYTLSFWYWKNHHAKSDEVIVEAFAPEGGPTLVIGHANDHLTLQMTDSPAVLRIKEAPVWWQRVTLWVQPNGRARLDYNGRQHLLPGFTLPTRLTRLRLGGFTDPAGGHWDRTFGRFRSGLIDDVRVARGHLPESSLAPLPGTADEVHSDFAFVEGYEEEAASGTITCEIVVSKPALHYLFGFHRGEWHYGRVFKRRIEYGGEYDLDKRVIFTDHHMRNEEQVPIRVKGTPSPIKHELVFSNYSDGCACYRIPSIVRAANGDLVAFAEARLESCSDSTGTIHLVCKRSTDGGATWQPLQRVVALDGWVTMNPAPVVDRQRGTIVVVFRAASHSEWDIARGVGLSRALCVTSTDHGVTWSTPRDITAQIHRPYQPDYAKDCPAAADPAHQAHDWRIQIPTTGHAIQLHGGPVPGRLFFIGSITRGDRSIFESENYAFWSDDGGETWTIGGIIPRIGLNEAIAAELADGSLVINTRSYTDRQPDGRRAVTRAVWTADGQLAFGPTTLDATLIDPAVQASLLTLSGADGSLTDQLVFSNPGHTRARAYLTLRLSKDGGRTWPISRVLEDGPTAYSDLVQLDADTIGVLYEYGNTRGIWFDRIPLDWLRGLI